MRNKLRKIYEKHENSIWWMYILLAFLFSVANKYQKIKEETNEALNNFEGNNITKKKRKQMYRKLVVYRYIYCIRANEYYLYSFSNVPYDMRDTFMTRQLTQRYYSVINMKRFRKVFDNKNLSYQVFNKYYKRDMICVRTEKGKYKFDNFIKDKDRFILKPFSGHSGEGIEIINKKDFKNDDELFNYTLERAPYVAEELIKQSDKLGCFHERSVNTIRVVTFQYKDDVSILWAFLRTGQGKYEVDNMGAAGLGALIDHNTGIIISDGVDWKGDLLERHPDSNIKFKGFKIPRWDELIEMVMNLASEIEEMHCVGWDLALTDDGWVLVEGNARPQCVTIQTFTKKGYRDYYNKMYQLVKHEKEEKARIMEGEYEN